MGCWSSSQAMKLSLSCLAILCSQSLGSVQDPEDKPFRPNIIFMMIDDVGFNDLGYLGCSTTTTPNIDNLIAEESLLLWYNYAFKLCSPSRSAFLSGRNPSNLGLQNLMFAIEYPAALTRQVSILSEEFKANGYSTHLIGKWHLGFPSQEYTPMYRGFDSFSGFLSGLNGYYDHTFEQSYTDSNGSTASISKNDYWLNEAVDSETVIRGINGEYSIWTEKNMTLNLLEDLKVAENPFFLYLAWQSAHTPNHAPDSYTSLYDNATSTARKSKQAQITILDESVRDVVDYLKENRMWDDTLIVFTSDNGGDWDRGDNSPLRQYKNSSFEGGVRVPGFVTGGYLAEDRRGQTMDQILVHMVDWYPTLLSAAGLEIGYHRSRRMSEAEDADTRFDHIPYGTVEIDGKDIWTAIQFGEYEGEMSYEQRELVLDLDSHVLNCTFNSCGAIRKGDWKFIRGANEARESPTIGGIQWQREYSTCTDSDPLGCSEYHGAANSLVCVYTEKGCLFNLAVDPCEVTNLGDDYPELRDYFISRLDYHQARAPAALMLHIDQLDFEYYDPETFCLDSDMGNGSFWCPFLSYREVDFEEHLMKNFADLWIGQNVNDTTENQRKAMTAILDLQHDQKENFRVPLKWKGIFQGHKSRAMFRAAHMHVLLACSLLMLIMLWWWGCIVRMVWCGWSTRKIPKSECSPLLIDSAKDHNKVLI